MVTRFVVATLVAALLDCGSAYAQVGGMSISPGPALGFTSPLGVGPGSRVAPTRTPMGASYDADPPRCDATSQSVGARFDIGEHGPMSDDCDRCPRVRGTAEYGGRVRSPFERQSPRLGIGPM